jgi:hypothetical protein
MFAMFITSETNVTLTLNIIFIWFLVKGMHLEIHFLDSIQSIALYLTLGINELI